MRNVYEYLMKHGAPAVFTALTGITLITSAAGVVKVAGNINSFKPKVPEIKTVETALKEDSNLSSPEASPSPRATVTGKGEVDSSSASGSHNVSVSPTPTKTQSVGLVSNTGIKPSVSIKGGDDGRDDSSYSKLEVDDDLEVSHLDSQINQTQGNDVQKQDSKDAVNVSN